MMTPCGSASTYSNWGCRCFDCSEAWRVYCISYRSRTGRLGVHGPQFPREPKHGTRYEYTRRGCRCDLCREAERDYMRKYRAKKHLTA